MTKKSHSTRTLSRREFGSVLARYGISTAVMLGFAGVPFGASVTEAAAQTAGDEQAKRAAAKNVMIFSIDGTLDRYPDGEITHETIYTNGSALFKERIETLSEGRIYVDLKPGGILGLQPGNKIRQGVIQAGSLTTQNCASLIPSWNVLDFPFVVGSPANMAKVHYSKEIHDTLGKMSEEGGLINLGGTTFMRWINLGQSVRKDVRQPADMEGLKIRVTNSRMELAGLQILGSNPTPISGGEIVTAMEQGVVDGFNIGPHFLTDFGLVGAVKQLVDVQFMPNTDCIFVNTDWMRGLAGDDQEAIMEAAFARQKYLIEIGSPVYVQQLGVSLDSPADTPIQQAGIKLNLLSDDERAVWKEAMSFERNPVLNELADRFGRKELDLLREVVAQGDATPTRWWK